MDNIKELIKKTTEKLGYKLVELNINDKYKNIIIIIYKKTGINIKDCQKLSRELLDDIEYIDKYGREYNLDVSSPGVSRIFKSFEEYNIFPGKEIKITSIDENNQNHTYTGVLEGTDDKNNILIENQYNLFKIPYKQIKKCLLLFESI